MQKAHNRLVEVIWELTDNCNQNCSYCGSKDILNKTEIIVSKVKKIATEIMAMKPDEVNISGGNPLLVSYALHEYVTKVLHSEDIICKIIVNPFNIKGCETPTLDLYDWIGVSINTKAELEEFKQQIKTKTTVITNFNTMNVFLFKEIESLVLDNKLQWQIQYTMYKGDNELAVYQNEEAKTYLANQIQKSKATIIPADNMNQGGCSAGLHSVGILANGDVVPCLSMRSWTDDLQRKGNLLNETLYDVWVAGFAHFRCNEFECCKDITNCLNKNKEIYMELPSSLPQVLKPVPPLPRHNENMTFMYGVKLPDYSPSIEPQDWSKMVMAYAVNMPKNTIVYAVTNDITNWSKYNLGTLTTSSVSGF